MISLPSLAEARRDFEPYLTYFRDVPRDAWRKAIAEGPPWMDASVLKGLAWVAMRDLARQRAPEYGLLLSELRQGRPVPLVHVPGERFDYVVRFNNLSDTLQAGGIDTRQRQLFEFQEPLDGDGQQRLPGLLKPQANIRTGYITDTFGLAVTRTPIVLSYNDKPVWWFDIEEDVRTGTGGATLIPFKPKVPKTGPVLKSESKKQKDEEERGSDQES